MKVRARCRRGGRRTCRAAGTGTAGSALSYAPSLTWMLPLSTALWAISSAVWITSPHRLNSLGSCPSALPSACPEIHADAEHRIEVAAGEQGEAGFPRRQCRIGKADRSGRVRRVGAAGGGDQMMTGELHVGQVEFRRQLLHCARDLVGDAAHGLGIACVDHHRIVEAQAPSPQPADRRWRRGSRRPSSSSASTGLNRPGAVFRRPGGGIRRCHSGGRRPACPPPRWCPPARRSGRRPRRGASCSGLRIRIAAMPVTAALKLRA